jgi:hypothetical protein
MLQQIVHVVVIKAGMQAHLSCGNDKFRTWNLGPSTLQAQSQDGINNLFE